MILLGVSGSVAAYKTPELVRLFVKAGFSVTPVLSTNAKRFVAPLALEAVAHSPIYEQLFDGKLTSPHLELARLADALVIAPASANVIAKLANGHADDLLSTLALSYRGPRILVPAMHAEMMDNPAVQSNLARLASDNNVILGPVKGDLAFGDFGLGRMVDLNVIVSQTRCMLVQSAPVLTGMKVLITAGGTQVPIDPVRVITNRSTGQLGHALAEIAAAWGASVTLISSADMGAMHPNIRQVSIQTPDELYHALKSEFTQCDALMMAAAVSDFTVDVSEIKISRSEPFTLNATPTIDMLAQMGRQKAHQRIIGFCLESDSKLQQRAYQKLVEKNCDVMVANTFQSMGALTRSASIYFANSLSDPVHISARPLFEFATDLLKSVFHDKMSG